MAELTQERIGVVGLGYVGLPVALAFARKFPETVGMDIDRRRVDELAGGHDRTREVENADLRDSTIRWTTRMEDLAESTFIVVTVPTPIDADRRPDLRPVRSATEAVARILKPGMIVVYESTVYPGVTEEICGPLLEKGSGLKCGVDFFLGYSPERINPGDKEHTLTRIVKVVAGQDDDSTERVANVYSAIIEAGVHVAPSIRAAEAAKVIENTQRDLNIALMNELALIFDRMGIRTVDVLKAAGTKWNFLPFRPGLVGGHCIGVDPYYLTAKAESLGYYPEVILAGRRINDGMGAWIAQRTVKLLIDADRSIKGARVGVLGLTFKENVPDLRNSRVPDVLSELAQFGIQAIVHDPHADPHEAFEEYGLTLAPMEELTSLDALIVAVGHQEFADLQDLVARVSPGGVFVDVKSVFEPADVPESVIYWSL